MSKWRANPKEKPKRYKSGDKWKSVESDDDLRSAAWAICRASTGLSRYPEITEEWEMILSGEDGHGVTCVGAAAVNDPHITGMDRLEVVWHNGKEMIRGQLLRFGTFLHPKAPKGKLIVNQALYDSLIRNFKENVIGRVPILDAKHEPNEGSLGEFVELQQVDDKLVVYIDPTSVGLQKVKDRIYNYLSAWLNLNYKGSEVAMSFSEECTEDTDIVELAAHLVAEYEEDNMPEKNETPETPPEDPKGEQDVVQLTREEFEQLQSANKDMEEKLGLVHKAIEENERLELELKAMREREEAREEELRLQRVDLFVEELKRPDNEGRMIDKATLELLRAGLRNDPLGEEGAEIKLSAESTLADVHNYYQRVLRDVGRKMPRVVPSSTEIEPDEQAKNKLEAKLSARREELMELATTMRGMSDEEADKFVEARLDKLRLQVDGR
jgi:hypothetical protein